MSAGDDTLRYRAGSAGLGVTVGAARHFGRVMPGIWRQAAMLPPGGWSVLGYSSWPSPTHFTGPSSPPRTFARSIVGSMHAVRAPDVPSPTAANRAKPNLASRLAIVDHAARGVP